MATGQVRSRESFANFVGEEAAFRYLASRHGPESEPVAAARRDFEDSRRWRELLHGLYRDLDTAYQDAALDDAARAERKAALFHELDERVDSAEFADAVRYHRAVARGTWNNARLAQFRTYYDSRPDFEALLDRHDGDLLAFMRDVQQATRHSKDPFTAWQKRARSAVTAP